MPHPPPQQWTTMDRRTIGAKPFWRNIYYDGSNEKGFCCVPWALNGHGHNAHKHTVTFNNNEEKISSFFRTQLWPMHGIVTRLFLVCMFLCGRSPWESPTNNSQINETNIVFFCVLFLKWTPELPTKKTSSAHFFFVLLCIVTRKRKKLGLECCARSLC